MREKISGNVMGKSLERDPSEVYKEKLERECNRSKYKPHQGKREMRRRMRRK